MDRTRATKIIKWLLLTVVVLFSWGALFQESDKEILSEFAAKVFLSSFPLAGAFAYGRILANEAKLSKDDWITVFVGTLFGAAVLGVTIAESNETRGFIAMAWISGLLIVGLVIGRLIGSSERDLLAAKKQLLAIQQERHSIDANKERELEKFKWESEFANELLEDYRHELVEAESLLEEAQDELAYLNQSIHKNIGKLSLIKPSVDLEEIVQNLMAAESDLRFIEDRLQHYLKIRDAKLDALLEDQA